MMSARNSLTLLNHPRECRCYDGPSIYDPEGMMVWNSETAANHAEQRARIGSQGQCAQYVREAIEAGGISLSRTRYAKDYGRNLENAGFARVSGTPQRGDVIVIQPAPGHPAGHMAIYNGSIWISDFQQRNGFYPGPAYRTARPSWQIYRHN